MGSENNNGFPAIPGVPVEVMTQDKTYNPEDFQNRRQVKTTDPTAEVQEVVGETLEEKRPLNRNLIIGIGVAVLVLIIIAIMLIARPDSSELPAEGDTEVQLEQIPIVEGVEGDTTVPAPAEPAFTEWDIPEAVVDEEGIVYAELTEKQMEDLRAFGYTSDQIEKMREAQDLDFTKVMRNARQYQINKVSEAYNFFLQNNHESVRAAMEELSDETWLGLERQQPENMESEISAGEWIVGEPGKGIAAYVKVPLYGNQTQLKLTMQDGTVLFWSCPPETYFKLRDERGSIVIRYEKLVMYGCTFITNIFELEV